MNELVRKPRLRYDSPVIATARGPRSSARSPKNDQQIKGKKGKKSNNLARRQSAVSRQSAREENQHGGAVLGVATGASSTRERGERRTERGEIRKNTVRHYMGLAELRNRRFPPSWKGKRGGEFKTAGALASIAQRGKRLEQRLRDAEREGGQRRL